MNRLKSLSVPAGSTVAFQGELGAFSQRAAHQILGAAIQPVPCASFDEVFEKVSGGKACFAVIPIENSLSGSIHQNFDLLTRHSLEAIAETFVRIEHHLIARAPVKLREISQIYSHPVALAQCQKFLRRVKRAEHVSFYDTAGSVKFIRDQGLRHAAAIASADAARIYRMKIICRRIEDSSENYTRFLALARRRRFSQPGSKTTIVFALKNEPGALFKALSVFALRNIDLTKIESRPIHGKPWEYLFYLDIRSGQNSPECANALRNLREMTLYFRLIGSYPTL